MLSNLQEWRCQALVFFSCNYVEFSFGIRSHRWFILGWFVCWHLWFLNCFWGFLRVTLSAPITEITVGFKLPDGIKWASFLCFQSSIWEVFVGDGLSLSLSLLSLRGCVRLLPLSVRVLSSVSLTNIALYIAFHGRFSLRTKTDIHVDRQLKCCLKYRGVYVWP